MGLSDDYEVSVQAIKPKLTDEASYKVCVERVMILNKNLCTQVEFLMEECIPVVEKGQIDK